MIKNNFRKLVACTLIFAVFPASAVAEHVKRMSGWVETITLGDPSIVLNAKIDTGAAHSSLHALEYTISTKGDREWVSFSVKDNAGKVKRFELPLLRYARIKQKDKQPGRARPVVKMGICLGSVFKEVDVNLVDRSNFQYPVLIGRSFLQGNFVVDPDHKFLNKPGCGT